MKIHEILKKFLSLSRVRQIAVCVCLVHFLAICAMTAHHFATRRLRPAKPIMVRTLPHKTILSAVSSQASSPAAVPASVKAPAKVPAAPRPETKPASATPPPAKKPTAKAETTKPAPVKSPPAAQTAPVKKSSPAKTVQEPFYTQEEIQNFKERDMAFKELAESLQSLAAASEPKPSRAAMVLPADLPHFQPKTRFEEEDANTNPSYAEYLIAYLQNTLDLPEQGEVRMRIEIDRYGKPGNCAILDSRSSKNAEFLKKRLPELTFPCFNDFGITDFTQTFTITFRNVENH